MNLHTATEFTRHAALAARNAGHHATAVAVATALTAATVVAEEAEEDNELVEAGILLAKVGVHLTQLKLSH